MYISSESLIVILFVGLVAGWLAGKVVRGAGFGIIGDIVIGIVGASSRAGCSQGSAFTSAAASSRKSSIRRSAPSSCC